MVKHWDMLPREMWMPHPRNTQGQAGWDFEQPDLLGAALDHCRVGLDHLGRSLQVQTILWFHNLIFHLLLSSGSIATFEIQTLLGLQVLCWMCPLPASLAAITHHSEQVTPPFP